MRCVVQIQIPILKSHSYIIKQNEIKGRSEQTQKQTNTNKANKQLFQSPKGTWKVPSRSKFSDAHVQNVWICYVLIYELFATQHLCELQARFVFDLRRDGMKTQRNRILFTWYMNENSLTFILWAESCWYGN